MGGGKSAAQCVFREHEGGRHQVGIGRGGKKPKTTRRVLLSSQEGLLYPAMVTRQDKLRWYRPNSHYHPEVHMYFGGGHIEWALPPPSNHRKQQAQRVGMDGDYGNSMKLRTTADNGGESLKEQRGPGTDRGCWQGSLSASSGDLEKRLWLDKWLLKRGAGARGQRFAGTLRDPGRRSSHLIGRDHPCAACKSSSIGQSQCPKT